METTKDERDLLDQLVDDGWPLAILAPGGGEVQRTALSLLEKGLVEVHGADQMVLHADQAEAIMRATESWDPGREQPTWTIRATEAGHKLLRDRM